MARDRELSNAARDFAGEIRTLLNCTVCDGAHVGSLLAPDGRAIVGTRLDKGSLDTQPVPLCTRASGVRCWLDVSYRLYLDQRGHLTATSSTYAIHTGPDAEHELFHYDYERDKDAYTEAHLQVAGENDALRQLMAAIGRPKRTLKHLHFPVGGRRFRPSLEDVLECLIHEGIASPKNDWEDALDTGRDKFRGKQLKAMVERHPEIAAEALEACGFDVTQRETEGSNVVSILRRRGRKGPRPLG